MIGSSRRQLRDRLDDLRAEHRVRVHDHPLLALEALLLVEDVVRHADLADVVEQAAPLERLEVRFAQTHLPPDVAAISLTRRLCLLVYGSRLSTAPASARWSG